MLLLSVYISPDQASKNRPDFHEIWPKLNNAINFNFPTVGKNNKMGLVTFY
jgi:hypothetical protein